MSRSAARPLPGLARLAGVLAAVAVGCGPSVPEGAKVVSVSRQDLVLDVEVTGTLKSLDSVMVSPPASVTDTWEFKIVRMVPEGTKIEAGQEVIAFDPSALEQKLKEYESEVAKVSEQLGQLRAERSLAVLNDRLDLADAQAKRRKADLKADKPPELTAELTLKASAIERELARREVQFRQERERAKRRQERSDASVLESYLKRAKGRVEEIKASIVAMAVKAPRTGTVVYKQDFRGEKKKVGDGMWRGEQVLEIASLDKMAAQGQVDEVDASKVAVGQRVGLRLEAHPDKEYSGTVERVAPLVQTESPESRVKVVGLEIKLHETDAVLMRPAMRFRGRIETARVPGVLQVPLAAIESTAAGPVVTKAGAAGPTSVKLGRRGREAVEVREGLAPGDRVLLRGGAASASPRGGVNLGPT